MQSAKLILENGAVFQGFSLSSQQTYGEVVFTTGMTGYPESLTDPSYAGQILTFTYPLIGNYGVPDKKEWESLKVHATGVVVTNACTNWSHHAGLLSLADWLAEQNVALITGVDTRAVTKILRQSGTMRGIITTTDETVTFPEPAHHLVSQVSSKQVAHSGSGKKKVLVVDCGMKENILRCLQKFPVSITCVPHDHDFTKEEYDGLFLSNGPGDPTHCTKTIEHLKTALKKDKPIFGICLGLQLLCLAAGAKTYKLPFGHRGQNQPCLEIASAKCFITSQNHGYAVEEKSLPSDWNMTFKNLNDGSVEGVAHKTKPFFAVQFHPEATPGPTDTLWLFEHFINAL